MLKSAIAASRRLAVEAAAAPAAQLRARSSVSAAEIDWLAAQGVELATIQARRRAYAVLPQAQRASGEARVATNPLLAWLVAASAYTTASSYAISSDRNDGSSVSFLHLLDAALAE